MTSRTLITAAIAVLTLTSPISAQNATNPIQVALLRWYQANAAVTFSVCSSGGKPGSLAFDGKHIWVTCYSGVSELQEFDSSDGRLVATVTQIFNSGQYAGLTLSNLLYDGSNIWVSGNSKPSIGAVARINVAAVNASTTNPMTCASLGTTDCMYITTGVGAFGMTFDGTDVWVANSVSNNLTKIPPTGIPTTVTPNANCLTPIALAFDTANIWITCEQSNSVQVWQVVGGSTQYTPLTGTGISTPTSIAYDGTYMWVASSGGTFNEIHAVTQPFTVNHPFTVPGGGVGDGIAFDGKYMWVINYSTDQVYKLIPPANPANTPQMLPPYNGAPGSNPSSPVFDGGNIWVVNSNLNSLSKF
jgi:hypothetical protein